VDDEPRVLDSLEAMLGMHYRVIRTARPPEALEMLARERIAVVISDQRMPGMLGTDLLARSLEVSPETVRILLTAFTDADALMASINAANIYHFVLKPWDPKELLHIVGQGVQRYRLGEEARGARPRPRAEERRPRGRARRPARGAGPRGARDVAAHAAAALRVPATRRHAVAKPGVARAPRRVAASDGPLRRHPGFTRLIETTRAPVMIRLLTSISTG